ncbi:Terminase large subunit [Roseomonas mucosa]|uniref:phage terminase large subunit family protein n=1 Tax=Roseomonas mucosa TaxID=207340 RepID=UPI0021FA7AF9|nr:phage terminase large subunit family protein [Roseomonas mucosa]QDJ10784.1 Terminase large subunit [Roseomonas mucosa]
MTSTLEMVRCRALAALIPPPRLALSEWIEGNLRLPEGVSALPGEVRLWPYQKEIADAISDPALERVTLVKSVRVGFTTLLTGALASFVANEPAPILALLPTEADCRDYIVSDVEPIFEASPVLRGLLAADTEEGGRNTLQHRRFPGGSLKVVAAKAPRNLRRHNVRILLIDEADAMEPGKEGSAIRLAERRTLSFANRKIVLGSTPLEADTSNVLRSYAASDQRVYEVPCPACGGFTEILWSHIEWEPGKPATAAFRCPHCETLVEERHKPAMVEAGRWRATCPEVAGHAGFRLNALVSLLANASWGKLAAEFLTAKEDSDELQTFVNTILAQGWRETAEELDEAALLARVEPFDLNAIPAEVLSITAGVDVQDDRLEVTLVGWSRTEALVLGHVVIWGTPDEDTTWAELDELLRTRWQHPNGGRLKVDAAVVDSGDGDWTDRVYAFCFPRLSRRVMAGKGVSGTRPALQASAGKVKGGRLFLVGVDGLKTTIASRLARGRSIRFAHTLDLPYFEQLTSERRVVRYTRGQPVRRFERKPGARAEALDCMVYAFAAHSSVTINLDQREQEMRGEMKAAPQAVIRSAWLGS